MIINSSEFKDIYRSSTESVVISKNLFTFVINTMQLLPCIEEGLDGIKDIVYNNISIDRDEYEENTNLFVEVEMLEDLLKSL